MIFSHHFQTLRNQIFFVFLLAFVIPFIISELLFYKISQDILLNQIKDNLKTHVYQNTASLETLITQINQSTVYLFTDKAIVDILLSDPDDLLDVINTRLTLNNLFSHTLTLPSYYTYSSAQLFINTDLPFSRNLRIYDSATQPTSRTGIYQSTKMTDMAWFKKTVQENGRLYSFIDIGNVDRLCIARSIKNMYIANTQGNAHLGVVRVCIEHSEFDNYITFADIAQDTRAVVLSAEGTVLYDNRPDTGKSTDFTTVIDTGNSRKNSFFDYHDSSGSWLTRIDTLDWGWKLVSFIPYASINKTLAPIQALIVVTTLFECLLSFIIAILLSKAISNPITSLAETMRRVKPQERSNIQFHPPYCDEVNELYNAFNHLLERTDQLLSEVATRKEMQKVAELKALQAQINPHYIYNTLDSVGWVALKRKQSDIADIVSLLADIIRYSIKNYGQMVLLSDEITHIENYMSIQSFRFSTKTTLTFDIPKKYYRIKIPKLIIQQLIENSLLHGFTGYEGSSGRIHISHEIQETFFILRVDDNGMGCNPEVLNAYLREENAVLMNSDGMGIKNVHERLRLRFGPSSGLIYEHRTNGGTSAKLMIPLEKIFIAPHNSHRG